MHSAKRITAVETKADVDVLFKVVPYKANQNGRREAHTGLLLWLRISCGRAKRAHNGRIKKVKRIEIV
jgi:hypothetical protein